ncbi:uncharacterized protein LOC128953946 [Oppia nitens]|uniref:uncharacterized protein LOC128953946 n=1 Tax=Oppia nitens TaxID=1686743 RepID=UPI0023DB082F|nr:uncharacterized protein LOC128953946 [Oppia nitens]
MATTTETTTAVTKSDETIPTTDKSLPKVRPENEYQRRCLAIVESMLATDDDVQKSATIDESRLLNGCRYITRGHYDDICTERSLCDQCGYPMCRNSLSTIRAATGRQRKSRFGAKQVYKIDTNKNKVYRKEELEKFCSPSCLAVSNYLRQQISEEAVYLRTTDTVTALGNIHLYGKKPDDSDDKENAVDISCQSEITSEELDHKKDVNRSTMKTMDALSYPYVKDECLQQLKDQMIGLTISERMINRHNDDDHNNTSVDSSDCNDDNND